MRRALAVSAVALCVLALAVPGLAADGAHVSIAYAAFVPARVQALTGTSVAWTNDGARTHTVTADDGSYDSGSLRTGDGYAHTYAAPGSYGYYCRLHAGMAGEVDVHDVLLDPVSAAAAPGREYPLRGRAAAGVRSVTLQADTGGGFADVGSAPVGDDGSFVFSVTPQDTTTYRAVTAGDASPPVTVLVLNRSVSAGARPARGGRWVVTARVTPASPRAFVVLQLRLRERFGWWPVAAARLGGDSRAVFHTRHHGRVPARVVLTLPDGATPLAISRVFHVGA